MDLCIFLDDIVGLIGAGLVKLWIGNLNRNPGFMVLNRDGYNLVLWHFSAGNLGLSWQQVEASHQIGVSQKAWDLVPEFWWRMVSICQGCTSALSGTSCLASLGSGIKFLCICGFIRRRASVPVLLSQDPRFMVMSRDGYSLVLWHFSAGNLGLSWHQVWRLLISWGSVRVPGTWFCANTF